MPQRFDTDQGNVEVEFYQDYSQPDCNRVRVTYTDRDTRETSTIDFEQEVLRDRAPQLFTGGFTREEFLRTILNIAQSFDQVSSGAVTLGNQFQTMTKLLKEADTPSAGTPSGPHKQVVQTKRRRIRLVSSKPKLSEK